MASHNTYQEKEEEEEIERLTRLIKAQIDKEFSKMPKDRLIVIKNKDKDFHESWSPDRNLANIPHPWRAVISGPPNSGKTNLIKNLLLRADPPFEQLYLCHIDPDSREYDDIDKNTIYCGTDIPSSKAFDKKKKNLIILDDLEYKNMKKTDLKNLDRLFGYISTHCNVSIVCTSQDPFSIPPCVRRMQNLLILFRGVDEASQFQLARKTGLRQEEFNAFMDQLINRHDSLWIDNTTGSPAPVRKNCYEILKKK